MANKKEGPVDTRMKLPLHWRHFCSILVHQQPGAWIDSNTGGCRGMQDAAEGREQAPGSPSALLLPPGTPRLQELRVGSFTPSEIPGP